MRKTGNRGISYCPYCSIKGFSYGSVYCPHKAPKEIPPGFLASEEKKRRQGLMEPHKTEPLFPLEKDYTFRNPGRRTDAQIRTITTHVARTGDNHFAKLHGIVGYAAIADSPSFDLANSAGICAMHLFFENVVPMFTRHLRGKGFKNPMLQQKETVMEASGSASTDEDEVPPSSDHANQEVSSKRKEKRKASSQSLLQETPKSKKKKKNKRPATDEEEKEAARIRAAAELYKKSNFVENDDPYNISKNTWARLGRDSENSNRTIPAAFCDTVRDIAIWCNKLKATNWKLWCLSLSPVAYLGELQEPFYSEYVNLVEAIRLSTKYKISQQEIKEIRARFIRLVSSM